MMFRKKYVLAAAALLTAASLAAPFSGAFAAEKDYQRVVVLSDVHYGSKEKVDMPVRIQKMERKNKAVDEINTWNDVDLCVFTGDMVELAGNSYEFDLAKQLTDRVKHPQAAVAGNHEIIYNSYPAVRGKLEYADQYERLDHLRMFREKYGPLYSAQKLGNYLLLFLSLDEIDGNFANGKDAYYVELSRAERAWLRNQLEANKDCPTLIFCHAPLKGTLLGEVDEVEFAYPSDDIRDILEKNPQVLVWASGHMHTPVTDPSFVNEVNKFKGTNVLNVHNSDWDDAAEICTNSFYLYPDKIMIRTWNHNTHQWMPQFDRTIPLPAELQQKAAKKAA
jgi:Icc protein